MGLYLTLKIQKPSGIFLSLTLGLIILLGMPTFSQDLKIGYHTGLREPLLMVVGEDIKGGILWDIAQELSRRTGLSFAFVLLPRRRLDEAMVTNTINVRSYTNPEWTEAPNSYQWSPPLYTAKDVIMTSSGFRPLKTLADLEGMRMGTLLGYVYPLIDGLFTQNKLLRDDVTDLYQNYLKLQSGRIDGMIADELLLRWYIRNDRSGMTIHGLIIAQFEIHWALSKSLATRYPTIIPTLARMVGDGYITSVIAKYR